MARRLVCCLLAVLAVATPAAQDDSRARYERALDDWDRGAYPEAIESLIALLEGPQGDRWLEDVALLTGEYHRSIEVSPPDRYVVNIGAETAPEWSPDGGHFLFETTDAGRDTIHLHRMENGAPRLVDSFDGFGGTFSPDGARAAFLRAAPGGAAASPPQQGASVAIVERDLAAGRETVLSPPDTVIRQAIHYGSDGVLYVTGVVRGSTPATARIYRIGPGGALVPLAVEPRGWRVRRGLAGGRLLVSINNDTHGILDPSSGRVTEFRGISPSASASGDAIVCLSRSDDATSVLLLSVADGTSRVLRSSERPTANPVLSRDGRLVAFQSMPREDWELFVREVGSDVDTRVTNEIQHDHTPQFLAGDRLLGIIGESRHRRSHVHDLRAKTRQRLFHNNTLRTLSMEHAWVVSPDGDRVLIVADRDGDTISPQRGIYVMDLTATVTRGDVVARLESMLAGERDLRRRGEAMFAAIAPQVRETVAETSIRRIYEYERDLVAFGSKYMTEPGNQQAADYIFEKLTSFGYAPEYQYFEPRGPRPGSVRTANVIATLRGTVSPEVEYLVSSHYDSVPAGPGADDDTSGTAALLESARVLRSRPMPATIRFLFLTGEEAGLLGSREYVRQAVARGDRIVGALNNDMVGFADNHRLDDTIRWANPGLRDLQHAAAFLFTNLITYDARYYMSTDAMSYVERFGEIVSGIGSYPILGNPHYHQPHDLLDTVNFALITEVSKTTTASIMLMASSPSPVQSVRATRRGGNVEMAWEAPPEPDVMGFVVRHWVEGQPVDQRVTEPRIQLAGIADGDAVWVKAVNAQGLESWDWARIVVGQGQGTAR